MNYDLGEADYRRAGAERLVEALVLYQREMFAGSVYLAERAVESMLRAVIWKHDSEIRTGKRSLETGHDLRNMLLAIGNLGVMNDPDQFDDLMLDVQHVGRLWFNNMRFLPTLRMKTLWWKARVIGKKQSLKQAVAGHYKVCGDIVKHCEDLCQS